jgi:GNAT superfamily N-acetyltransferase
VPFVLSVIEQASGIDRPSAADARAQQRFSLRLHPSREEWHEVEGWMVEHGWDPGYGDARAVLALDSRALMVGYVDDVPVSAISVLQIGESYAFAGNLFVRREWRGRGFGRATWDAAILHATGRTIGLEAAPEMVPVYERLGFIRSHETVSYRGRIRPAARSAAAGVRPVEPSDRDALVALDAQCSPHDRKAFLTAWIAAGERTLVYSRGPGHGIEGFGTIHRCRTGVRIGPLIAATSTAARAVFDTLTAPYRGEQVVIEAPTLNLFAAALARDRSLERGPVTARMYSTPVRPTALAYCYALASPNYG